MGGNRIKWQNTSSPGLSWTSAWRQRGAQGQGWQSGGEIAMDDYIGIPWGWRVEEKDAAVNGIMYN